MAFRSLLQRRRVAPVSAARVPVHAIQLTRQVPVLQLTATLEKAIHLFRTQNLSALPVVDAGELLGWVTDDGVTAALTGAAEMDPALATIAEVMETAPAAVHPMMSPREALDLLHETGCQLLPVTFADGRHYLGCVTRGELLGAIAGRLAPPRLGGMATPLGVYLTTGAVSGGAGTLGLLLTGVVMGVQLWFVQIVLFFAMLLLYRWTHHQWIFAAIVNNMNGSPLVKPSPAPLSDLADFGISLLNAGLIMTGFFTMLRFMPRMAGFHAAEHQTVNAIEAGEPLTVAAVGRMSRVHPRCGTNLWGLLSMVYIGVVVLTMVVTTHLGQANLAWVEGTVFVYILFVAANWRRVGGWMQQHFTTRPATAHELASGIRAADEVLRRHLANPTPMVRPLVRIWNMGLAQVLAGVILIGYLLQFTGVPLDELTRKLLK